MMERLAIGEGKGYLAIEAAIHINRYAIASGLCKDKRVLDLACGEGYGSHLMATRWGAREVIGVDISSEAVESAQSYFKAPNIAFKQGSAEELLSLVEPSSVDLIICLETFEHVTDPKVMLQNFRTVLKPGGVIIISCPNDHWYYRSDGEGNPFHARKYFISEFKEISQAVLGEANSFFLGVPLSGFINVAESQKSLSGGASYLSEFDEARFSQSANIEVAPSEVVSHENCAYFIGVWGPVESSKLNNATFFPASMDQHLLAHKLFDTQNLSDEVKFLRSKVFDLERDLRLSGERLSRYEAAGRIAADSVSKEEITKTWNAIRSELTRLNEGIRAERAKELEESLLVGDKEAASSDCEAPSGNEQATYSELDIRVDPLSHPSETLEVLEQAGREIARLREELTRLRRHSALKHEAVKAENDYLRGECLAIRSALEEAKARGETAEQQLAEANSVLVWHQQHLHERCSHITNLEARLATLKTIPGFTKAILRKVRSRAGGNGALGNT